MTETVDAPTTGSAATRGGSLTTMRLPELQALAAEIGLKGTAKMRKSDLITAIREARGDGRGAQRTTSAPKQVPEAAAPEAGAPEAAAGRGSAAAAPRTDAPAEADRSAAPLELPDA
ncbi:Rho termination factor N-terminal domain-containing protein, partial [Georgenia sp. EYE_87]|uniref:Rho termination factor N-terminal domain-containing protein n=1 Tax=Georgenia sp. EYE_87 TaxID=2853448 RepID=UPI0020063710